MLWPVTYPKRNEEGWKLTDLSWIAHLEFKIDKGELTRAEADLQTEVHFELDKYPHPQEVEVGTRFKQCHLALEALFESMDPPTVTVRSKRMLVVMYGFVDASGSGFGSTVLHQGTMHYRIGTWSSQEDTNSSNWREFKNLVVEVERSGEHGWLEGATMLVATDNEVVETSLYKGKSGSEKL